MKNFVIKVSSLYYTGCINDGEELLFSDCITSAQQFEDLEDLEVLAEKYNIKGYSVSVCT